MTAKRTKTRRKEHTNHNQACHLQTEIHHHSRVCMYPLSFIVCLFNRSIVHASGIISQERKKKGVSQGATQWLDRDNKREKTETVQTKKDHHVETNKQTTIKLATYTLRFIIHGYACIHCHCVFVRSCDRSFVRACVSHHITREKEGKKKGVSQEGRHRETQ